jgi:hypothetical protein
MMHYNESPLAARSADPLTRPALGPRRRACRTGDLMAEFRQSGCGLALAAKKS